MQFSDMLSSTLHNRLQQTFGMPFELETLGSGQSEASVYRVSFPAKTVILKKCPSSNEKLFYESVAPLLNEKGINTPRLEWAEYADGFYWLVLEAIPHSLPRERWQSDPEVIFTLRRLHSIPLDSTFKLTELYAPQWTEELTSLALKVFPEKARLDLAPFLSELQKNYQHLFEPQNLISGDPNPTNWGLREDGSLVLFDWERFGYGTPALDLAISVGGMGNKEIFRQIAASYLKEQPDQTDSSIEELAQDIAIAKIWSVLEYLSFFARLKSFETLNYLIQHFEEWVKTLF